jgi:glucose/arabinose dehydrogenase
MWNLSKAAALLLIAATPAVAQVNAGEQQPEQNIPFNVTQVATFNLPWRIAFLPDGQMLVTEKAGPVWLVSQDGQKTEVANVPAVVHQGQGGMLGVYLSPNYASDHSVYLTYAEPNEGGSSLALARAALTLGNGTASLEGLEVVWHDPAGGTGGQFGGAVAFSPDNQYLFLTVGDRQRMAPAQDPDSPLGKTLRLTLNGEPAPGNPNAGSTGAQSLSIINPPSDTETAKNAPVVRTFTYSGSNLTPSETWTSGHRTPYGLAFDLSGNLWELEHGPRGGDELNLLEPGSNYGWPLVSYAANYNGVPIPSPDSRSDLAKPAIYWNPVIAPGNLMFYDGDMFPQWQGSGFASGMDSLSLTRFVVDGKSAEPVERWNLGFRVRDIAVAPDGAIWMLEDKDANGLYRVTPK